MKSSQFLVLILAFAVGMGVSFFLVYRLLNARLEERLQAIRSRMVDEDKPLAGRLEIWAREWLSKLVRFSMDEEKWENSPLRIRFLNAGYRGDLIIIAYFGSKTLLTLCLPVLYLIWTAISGSALDGADIAMRALGFAAAGYYLPNLLLDRKIKNRQRELFESFPDALDLIRVCVSAASASRASCTWPT